jgi:hypothetical protein
MVNDLFGQVAASGCQQAMPLKITKRTSMIGDEGLLFGQIALNLGT